MDPGRIIATVSANHTSYFDTDLRDSTTYHYRLQSLANDTCSGYVWAEATTLNLGLTLIGECPTSKSAMHLSINENFLYLATDSTLIILDIEDPRNPRALGSVSFPDWIIDLCAIQGYVYIANPNQGIRVVDISNPEAPTTIALYEIDVGTMGVCAYEGLVYINDYWNVKIVDFTTPTSPVLVGQYFTGYHYHHINGFFVSDSRIYLAAADSGLAIIDIADPTSPTLLSLHATGETAFSVRAFGSYVYVRDRGGFRIFDISNPYTPILIGNLALEEGSELSISFPYAYVQPHSQYDLYILDISNPANPAYLAYFGEHNSFDILSDGTYIYLAMGPEGVAILRYLI